jgi:hypothetical protein
VVRDPNDKEVRAITTEFSLGKNRGAKDSLNSYFCWSKEQEMFLTCEKPKMLKNASETQNLLTQMRSKPSWSWTTLLPLIMKEYKIKERSAERRIEALVKNGAIIKSSLDGSYSVPCDTDIASIKLEAFGGD